MGDLNAVEIKAFVPARDFVLSKQFYEDLGFTIAWSDSDLAYLRCGDCSFLLQNFYHPEHAGNFMKVNSASVKPKRFATCPRNASS